MTNEAIRVISIINFFPVDFIKRIYNLNNYFRLVHGDFFQDQNSHQQTHRYGEFYHSVAHHI
jgi:hypothetical protein